MSERSLGHLAIEKANALCDELAATPEQRAGILDALALMGAGWLGEILGDSAPFQNDLTDDSTPFEFSTAFSSAGLEVRVLAEPQRAPFDTRSNWQAGLALHEVLRARGVDLSRFESVAWLFEPAPGQRARFALWHAAAVASNGHTICKVYLNPQIRGKEHALETTRRALQILGLERAWDQLDPLLEQHALAEIAYVSLDLDASPSARVKVYVAYPGADIRVLDTACCVGRDYVPGDARRWIESMTDRDGPFSARPMLVCYAFDGREEQPRTTLHVPVRSYTGNDAEVLERFGPWVSDPQANAIRAALPRLSGRPLDAGRGLITYASFQPRTEGLRVTLYLAPQLYAIAAPRASSMPLSMSYPAPVRTTVRALKPETRSHAPAATMQAMQDEMARQQAILREHPFLRRLEHAGMHEIRVMAETLTFWVLCFQDVLRLGSKTVTDPRIAMLAQVHADEDHGHEQWFLNDVRRLGAERDLRWVFGREQAIVRDISYSLVAEVLKAIDDRARLAVLLSLDAIGGMFFELVVRRLEAHGNVEGLEYFARSHQEIELGHEIFDSGAHDRLMAMELPAESVDEVLGAVRRCYAALTALADELDARMTRVTLLIAESA